MTNLLFELQLDAPKNELIKSASDFENFTQYLPAQLQKIEIIEQSNDKIITKETLQFSSILKKQIEIQCEHTIDSNKIFTKVIQGPAENSIIIVTFEANQNGTLVKIDIDLKLGLKYKILLPLIKKWYKFLLQGVLYKINTTTNQNLQQ
jgi:hypothetical protein